MKLISVAIHNFRALGDARFACSSYGVLVGANNSGKSSVFTAIRMFYEDGTKFDSDVDFPKFDTADKDSWIEMEYFLKPEELESLKEDYRPVGEPRLKVRRYFRSADPMKFKAGQSNIYAYEKGELSRNLFYGAKNVSEAKLGSVIYIPEVAKTDDSLKMSGPSPLRDVVSFVMKKVVGTSASFARLNVAFDEFNRDFAEEKSKDGFSLARVERDINDSIKEWEVTFGIDIQAAKPDEIVKNLVSHRLTDESLKKEVDVKSFGQGLQRHLIYTLLRLAPGYEDTKTSVRKEFNPNLTIILFEEPEAFLHPAQQEILYESLKQLSEEPEEQVLVTTHSPVFVSRHIQEITALVRCRRTAGRARVFQVSPEGSKRVYEGNNELLELLKAKRDAAALPLPTRARIKALIGETTEEEAVETEILRYALWLDAERSACFFADVVMVCEGATEKTLIDYLIRNEWKDLRDRRIYVMDAMGKLNIHRYMNLFLELGINHGVLVDRDEDASYHEFVNKFLVEQQNEFTLGMEFLAKDVEAFLGIPLLPRDKAYRRPLNALLQYKEGKIPPEKIAALREKCLAAISGKK